MAQSTHVEALRAETHDLIDRILKLLVDCEDQDVTFQPEDPLAHDPYAETEDGESLAWTLGHVIVHATASAEEAAAIAAELARGVDYHGRSRSEVPWSEVRSVEQCVQRLEESRRMRVASLDMWPDRPDLKRHYRPQRPGARPMNAVQRFRYGLDHERKHLRQMREIIQQAKAARGPA